MRAAVADKLKEIKRRKVAAMSIAFTCIGVLLFTSAASAEFLPRHVLTLNLLFFKNPVF